MLISEYGARQRAEFVREVQAAKLRKQQGKKGYVYKGIKFKTREKALNYLAAKHMHCKK